MKALLHPVQADTERGTQGSSSVDEFLQIFTNEFSLSKRISASSLYGLAEIVNGLLNDKLPEQKFQEVQSQYVRPENCSNLVAPKVNKKV